MFNNLQLALIRKKKLFLGNDSVETFFCHQKLIIGIVFFIEFSFPKYVCRDRNEFSSNRNCCGFDSDVDGGIVPVIRPQRLVTEAVAVRDVAAVRREELAHVVRHRAATKIRMSVLQA